MATPSTNEVLFVVIVVILFFIFLGLCIFCIYKATGPRKDNNHNQQQQQVELYAQQQQYITASQLESMRPPELAHHLNSVGNKRRSMLDKLILTPQGVVRPSSTRQPSFLPMQHQAMAARDAQIAAMVAAQPPPAYGDYRASVRLDQSLPAAANDEKR